jgi:hypothetical protein
MTGIAQIVQAGIQGLPNVAGGQDIEAHLVSPWIPVFAGMA